MLFLNNYEKNFTSDASIFMLPKKISFDPRPMQHNFVAKKISIFSNSIQHDYVAEKISIFPRPMQQNYVAEKIPNIFTFDAT